MKINNTKLVNTLEKAKRKLMLSSSVHLGGFISSNRKVRDINIILFYIILWKTFYLDLQKNVSTAQILYILKLIANVNTRRTEY
jgi:hypothetical protein